MYRTLVEQCGDIVIILQDQKVVYSNQVYKELLGWDHEEVESQSFLSGVAPEHRDRIRDYHLRRLRGEPAPDCYEFDHLTSDGKRVPVETKPRIIEYRGRPAVMVTMRDIRGRKQAETKLQESEERYRGLFESAPDGYYLMNLAGEFVDGNRAAEALIGYEREELIGKSFLDLDLLSPKELLRAARSLQESVSGSMVGPVEFWLKRKDGTRIPVEIKSHPLEIDGQTLILGSVRNIAERKEAETKLQSLNRQLEKLAHFDVVTGLPNRFLFEDRLERAIARTRRNGRHVALHYLDLDHYKNVNDRFGHAVGDELLKAVGNRLARIVRKADTVARLGGDEFAIIQEEGTDPRAATTLAQRVLEELSTPFRVHSREIHTGTSIGIAVSSPAVDPEVLMLQADTALYKAKEEGRHRFRFHSDEMDKEIRRCVSLGEDLHVALSRGQFLLEYQAQVDLGSGSTVGSEALVRWRHPRRGLLSPLEFIPVAEDTGLIVPLGEWIVETACRHCKLWCEHGSEEVSVAVNVSAAQLKEPGFAEKVLQILDKVGLRPDLLELELTESILMEGGRAFDRSLRELHDRGVRIAIDDFGTGYSSLQYLRLFPVHKLKIAMEFVQGLETSPDDAAIVEAIVGLGHRLGLRVVAEGVETKEQLAFLRACGCDEAQGFYFSKPISPESFTKLFCPGSDRIQPRRGPARQARGGG